MMYKQKCGTCHFRRIVSFIKKMLSNLIYRTACKCVNQSTIVLYTSLNNDNFGNISSISKKMNELGIEHVLLYKNDMLRRPIRFFTKIASAKNIGLA